MSDSYEKLKQILPFVKKPSRYIGGEYHSIQKNPATVRLNFALCFPDLYEIGMSHLGFRILYHLLNADQEIMAERFFAPWVDMRSSLKEKGLSLLSLELGRPLKEFDIVGFSLQYELNYTNVLMMLDLGGIPIKSTDRRKEDPIIIAGGPAAFNPEPMAEFIDLFVIGDGEEIVMELAELYKKIPISVTKREEFIQQAADLEGIYVPALFEVKKQKSGFLIPYPIGNVSMNIRRRILKDIDKFPFPEKIIVPHGEIVHDRVSYEIMRGCLTGCRFCQAGYIYRPRRERDPESIRRGIRASICKTGYEDVSLSSLNSGEYEKIEDLLQALMNDFSDHHTFLSLPSLKPSTLSTGIVKQIKRGRKTGLTLVPEAGTEKLRKVINKNTTREDILRAAEEAFKEGWNLLKLYFMIGLPMEDEQDISGMVDLIHEIFARSKRLGNKRGRINVSLSSFIPKPHTPFQWMPMESVENLLEKQTLIREKLSHRSIRVKWHNVKMSFLEAVFSRGDRRLSSVIKRAFDDGCVFDGWGDQFHFSKWEKAFASCCVDPSEYAYRKIDREESLPWDLIDTGVSKEFLLEEWQKALKGETTKICGRDRCHACGETMIDLCRKIWESSGEKKYLRESQGPISMKGSYAGPQYRYRAKYEKKGKIRFLSHLDTVRTIVRGFRRAGVPLLYSCGFHPKPRISFGPALAVGVESEAEYLDFYTYRYLHEKEFLDQVNQYFMKGLKFTKLKMIPKSLPSLSNSINRTLYRSHHIDEKAKDFMDERIQKLEREAMNHAMDSERRKIKNLLRMIKEISRCEDGRIEFLLSMEKRENLKLGDIFKILLQREDWMNLIEKKEMFIEKRGRMISPFMISEQVRIYVQRNDH